MNTQAAPQLDVIASGVDSEFVASTLDSVTAKSSVLADAGAGQIAQDETKSIDWPPPVSGGVMTALPPSRLETKSYWIVTNKEPISVNAEAAQFATADTNTVAQTKSPAVAESNIPADSGFDHQSMEARVIKAISQITATPASLLNP